MKKTIYAIFEDGTNTAVKEIECESAFEATVCIQNNQRTLKITAQNVKNLKVLGFNLTGHMNDALKRRATFYYAIAAT